MNTINWGLPLIDLRDNHFGERVILIATNYGKNSKIYSRVVYFFSDQHIEILTDCGRSNIIGKPIVSNFLVNWNEPIIDVKTYEQVEYVGILNGEDIFKRIIKYADGRLSVVTDHGQKFPGSFQIIKNGTIKKDNVLIKFLKGLKGLFS
jgi:hypothetical protein